MGKSRVIAIDGPSGSGKSTIAKSLADHLKLLYIDTGAMFRALAYSADQAGVSLESGPEMEDFLSHCHIEYGTSLDQLIVINGKDLTEIIREHHVSKLASIISKLPEVRGFLLNFQRDLALELMCVMEGRDIGTIVFPDSFCKIFITASVEVRAQRRFKQLKENGNQDLVLDQVIEDVVKRDESDMNREVAPLKKADDAYFLDTTHLGLDEILERLENVIAEKAGLSGFPL